MSLLYSLRMWTCWCFWLKSINTQSCILKVLITFYYRGYHDSIGLLLLALSHRPNAYSCCGTHLKRWCCPSCDDSLTCACRAGPQQTGRLLSEVQRASSKNWKFTFEETEGLLWRPLSSYIQKSSRCFSYGSSGALSSRASFSVECSAVAEMLSTNQLKNVYCRCHPSTLTHQWHDIDIS